jgi:hypothetical protein
LSIGGALVPLLPHQALAGKREAERAQEAAEKAREQAEQSAERAREQAQQSAERAREQAQRAAERAREQANQSREREANRSESAPSQRDRDTGNERRREDESSSAPKSTSGRDRRDDNKSGQNDDGPPKTVLELIKRITSPKQNGHIAHAGAHPALASREVLAVGLSRSAIARARALGFKPSASQHGRITHLIAPGHLDADSARGLLRSEVPEGRFGLNYLYHPYRSATGDEGRSPPAQGVRKAHPGGCDAERCYGAATIGWQSHLRHCAQGARIGVIDTAVDRAHPTFQGRHLEIKDFRPRETVTASSGHGTGVLAVLAGSPDSGTPGLVPDARFFVADVYRGGNDGHPETDTASLLRALDWLADSKVGVINMSMSGPRDELLEKAIAEMSARGTTFVAAAGNGGPNAPPSYPAAYEQVIAVTAIDKNFRGYMHANHGDYIDLAAPGVGIWTALPNVLEGYQSGTSFAAPHVTAIVAVVRDEAQDRSKEGILQALTVRDLGPAGRDRVYGRGIAIAPSACTSRDKPTGWTTSVVGTPDLPWLALPSGTAARSAAYK